MGGREGAGRGGGVEASDWVPLKRGDGERGGEVVNCCVGSRAD